MFKATPKLFLVLSLLINLSGCAIKKNVPTKYTYIDHIQIVSHAKNIPTAVIAANMYLPIGPPRATYPGLILPNSWGLNQYEYRKKAQELATRGYVVLSYSARGWGKSTGQVDAGGAADMADIHTLIDWLIIHAPVKPNHLGMVGISYGGGLSLLGAAHDPRIHAVVSLSGWTNLFGSLYDEKTPSIMSAKILVQGAQKRHAPLNPELLQLMTGFKNYNVTPTIKAWAFKHSAISYLNQFKKNKTAILLSNNFQDKLFNPTDSLDFYNKINVPHKLLLLNQGIHASAEAGGILGKPNRVWDEADRWLDRYLKGRAVTTKHGIYVQFPNQHHYVKYNPKLQKIRKLHLNYRKPNSLGLLTRSAQRQENKINALSQGQSGMNSGTSRFVLFELLKLMRGFLGGHPSLNRFYLGSINWNYNLFYIDPKSASQKTLTIVGQPKTTLWIKISNMHPNTQVRVQGQLIAYLYDVDHARHRATLISLAPITYYTATTPINQWVKTTLKFHVTAYKLPKGHYLALGLGTQDNLYTSQVAHWPQNKLYVRYCAGATLIFTTTD